jgi:hypothetical protein
MIPPRQSTTPVANFDTAMES